MGETTAISWCDSTLNLMMGCNGCELWAGDIRTCYAGVLTERHGGGRGWPTEFRKPKLFPQRLADGLAWRDLRGVHRPEKPWLDKEERFEEASNPRTARSTPPRTHPIPTRQSPRGSLPSVTIPFTRTSPKSRSNSSSRLGPEAGYHMAYSWPYVYDPIRACRVEATDMADDETKASGREIDPRYECPECGRSYDEYVYPYEVKAREEEDKEKLREAIDEILRGDT